MKPPAYKLPHLLSLLPKDGKSALVRPVQWPTDSFYKVQKSALKFRPVEGSSEIRAGGRAYGQLFWKGKPISSRKLVPKIKNGLKHRWVTVEKEALGSEVLQALKEADEVLVQKVKVHEEKMEAFKAARREKCAPVAAAAE